MLDRITAADFTPHLNTPFTLTLNERETTDLTLISVTSGDARGAPPGAGRAPFTLLFHAPHTGGVLPQQIWRLEHETLGALEIFLVPIGQDTTGARYEAVFN